MNTFTPGRQVWFEYVGTDPAAAVVQMFRTQSTTVVDVTTLTSQAVAITDLVITNGSLGAQFTGVIAVTTGILTASSVTGEIVPGATIYGAGVPAGTVIVSQLTGPTGGAGTYQTNITTAVASIAMVTTAGVLGAPNNVDVFSDTLVAGNRLFSGSVAPGIPVVLNFRAPRYLQTAKGLFVTGNGLVSVFAGGYLTRMA